MFAKEVKMSASLSFGMNMFFSLGLTNQVFMILNNMNKTNEKRY